MLYEHEAGGLTIQAQIADGAVEDVGITAKRDTYEAQIENPNEDPRQVARGFLVDLQILQGVKLQDLADADAEIVLADLVESVQADPDAIQEAARELVEDVRYDAAVCAGELAEAVAREIVKGAEDAEGEVAAAEIRAEDAEAAVKGAATEIEALHREIVRLRAERDAARDAAAQPAPAKPAKPAKRQRLSKAEREALSPAEREARKREAVARAIATRKANLAKRTPEEAQAAHERNQAKRRAKREARKAAQAAGKRAEANAAADAAADAALAGGADPTDATVAGLVAEFEVLAQ